VLEEGERKVECSGGGEDLVCVCCEGAGVWLGVGWGRCVDKGWGMRVGVGREGGGRRGGGEGRGGTEDRCGRICAAVLMFLAMCLKVVCNDVCIVCCGMIACVSVGVRCMLDLTVPSWIAF